MAVAEILVEPRRGAHGAKIRTSGSARNAVHSYESGPRRGHAPREGSRLTHDERAELLLSWAGYTTTGATRSSYGLLLDATLRRRPRLVPRLVAATFQRHGFVQERDRFVEAAAAQGRATRYEIGLTIDTLRESEQITQWVDMAARTVERIGPGGECVSENVLMPTEMIRLERIRGEYHPKLSREERWTREDAELEQFCQGYIPCKESHGGCRSGDIDAIRVSAPYRRARAVYGIHRTVLERLYGTSTPSPRYRDVFGAEIALVAAYTDAAREARIRLGLERNEDALAAMLDGAPSEPAARDRWRADRAEFVRAVTKESDRLISAACDAFRGSRS